MKYALNYKECRMITLDRSIQVDGKVRTDMFYPAGFMDVITIEKTNQRFRLLYDVKGRFSLTPIKEDEAQYKLCRVKKLSYHIRAVPFLVTHDGRTIRYPSPEIKRNDTIKISIPENKILDHIKFETGNVVMISGGNSIGRVGILQHVEKHPGSFDMAYIKDAKDHTFTTRMKNVVVIGKGKDPWITLPKGKGLKLSIVEERNERLRHG